MTWRATVVPVLSGSIEIHEEEKADMTTEKAPTYRVPAGSTASMVSFVLENEDGTDVDPTGLTVSAVLFNAATLAREAVTTDAAGSHRVEGGKLIVEYELTAAEVGLVRTLECDFEVQFSSSNLVTKRFLLEVERRARVGA